MSNLETLVPVSALQSAQFSGFAEVREVGLRAMITLRADLAAAYTSAAVQAACGLSVPGQRELVQSAEWTVAWMSPDELLLMGPYDQAENAIALLEKALNGQHYLCVDVSDSRAVFQVSGAGAREVIAKLAPVDMSRFAMGEIRRSRLAQVAAAFWLVEGGADGDIVQIICFRSVAQYVFDVLKTAAEPGSEVGFIS